MQDVITIGKLRQIGDIGDDDGSDDGSDDTSYDGTDDGSYDTTDDGSSDDGTDDTSSTDGGASSSSSSSSSSTTATAPGIVLTVWELTLASVAALALSFGITRYVQRKGSRR